MNDKQQLAAMGDELRLTEEQAKGLAERLPQMERSGVLQLTDSQPLCMAKRIEELEAQGLAMAGLLRETLNMVPAIGVQVADLPVVDGLLERIDAALSGKMPEPAVPSVPDGWQLVPVEPTREMSIAGCQVPLNKAARHNTVYRAMLAAVPKSGAKP